LFRYFSKVCFNEYFTCMNLIDLHFPTIYVKFRKVLLLHDNGLSLGTHQVLRRSHWHLLQCSLGLTIVACHQMLYRGTTGGKRSAVLGYFKLKYIAFVCFFSYLKGLCQEIFNNWRFFHQTTPNGTMIPGLNMGF
jgi:hypothetical protein